ncbi:MAG: TetR/AcrR family transcriptional regulator [Bacteroidota bacterium]
MKSTPSAIIAQAIILFNTKGFFNVSVKDIAQNMGISPGNLTYHFKKKEYLLSAIQQEMFEMVDGIIIPKGQYLTLKHFEEVFNQFFQVQQKYRFYFSDIQYLMAEYPDAINDYKRITTKRFKDARELVDYYIATNRIVEENERVNYNDMIHNLWAISTFWTLSRALIDVTENKQMSYDSPIQALWSILLPFLTEKGYAEYKEILLLKNENKITNL